MDEKKLGQVRALLNKAEAKGVTPEEAKSLTAKAAELMAKYGIDQALVDAQAEVKVFPVDVIRGIENPFASAKTNLFVAIARAFNCRVVMLNNSYGLDDGKAIHVFGFKSDIEAIDILYTSLLLQGTQESLTVPAGENSRSWRTSFWYGYASIIGERLTKATDDAKADKNTPGTALVLRDRKLAVDDAVSAKYSKLRKVTRYVGSNSGYNSGKAAGQRANLHNRASTQSSSRRALDR
jgi:hypothetical protein